MNLNWTKREKGYKVRVCLWKLIQTYSITFLCVAINQGTANSFYNIGSSRDQFFRLSGTYSLSHNELVLLLQYKWSHRQYINDWVWLCYLQHWNLNLIYFSCVIKHYYPSFDFFQLLKHAKGIVCRCYKTNQRTRSGITGHSLPVLAKLKLSTHVLDSIFFYLITNTAVGFLVLSFPSSTYVYHITILPHLTKKKKK
jgi:hypothetical protein